VRAADVQRQAVKLFGGQLDAPQDVAHLRAVAVRDDELVAVLDQGGQVTSGIGRVFELLGDIALLPGREIAFPPGDDQQAFCGRSPSEVSKRQKVEKSKSKHGATVSRPCAGKTKIRDRVHLDFSTFRLFDV